MFNLTKEVPNGPYTWQTGNSAPSSSCSVQHKKHLDITTHMMWARLEIKGWGLTCFPQVCLRQAQCLHVQAAHLLGPTIDNKDISVFQSTVTLTSKVQSGWYIVSQFQVHWASMATVCNVLLSVTGWEYWAMLTCWRCLQVHFEVFFTHSSLGVESCQPQLFQLRLEGRRRGEWRERGNEREGKGEGNEREGEWKGRGRREGGKERRRGKERGEVIFILYTQQCECCEQDSFYHWARFMPLERDSTSFYNAMSKPL